MVNQKATGSLGGPIVGGCEVGESLMKLKAWYLPLALVPVALLLINGTFGAQLLVLAVTLGIFFGTLSLRRPETGDATTTHSGH